MATNKNDILGYGLKIFQNDDYFKFSIDSILLAEFVKIKLTDKKLLDMCTGNAPLLLVLANKMRDLDYYGFEIQKEIYDLAQKSVIENKLNIKIINDDIKNLSMYFKGNYFDIITCNPPYFKVSEKAILNDSEVKSIARHELKIKLEEVIKIAYNNLKKHGYFYLVHRTDRFMEIVNCLKKNNFSIKRIQFAYKNKSNTSCCILFECVKDGKTSTMVEPPIYIDEFLERGEK